MYICMCKYADMYTYKCVCVHIYVYHAHKSPLAVIVTPAHLGADLYGDKALSIAEQGAVSAVSKTAVHRKSMRIAVWCPGRPG